MALPPDRSLRGNVSLITLAVVITTVALGTYIANPKLVWQTFAFLSFAAVLLCLTHRDVRAFGKRLLRHIDRWTGGSLR